jgi:putative oxidoreductase
MWANNLALLILRLGCGLPMALLHGVKKLPPPPELIQFVTQQGWPYPAFWAWSASFAEFFGAILIIVGLGTRIAGGLLAIAMLVAFLLGHVGQGFDQREMAFVYLSMSVALMLLGGGDWALDRFVSFGRKKKS